MGEQLIRTKPYQNPSFRGSHTAAMADVEFSLAELPSLYLMSAFLAMEPPDSLICLAKECTGESITEEIQRFIWEHCVLKSGEKIQPLYLKNFLKKMIREVESTGGAVLDEFYQQYADYMASIKDGALTKENSWMVKSVSFIFHDEALGYSGLKRLVVPLQCSVNMLEGDTGCTLWPSCLFLSEFILSFPGVFKNRSCFEVGSGVGLVGICLSHVKASKVIMSDGDLSSLANLKRNLEINQPSKTQKADGDTTAVECIHLPWDLAKDTELQALNPDIILGADVIYDPSYLPHLVRVLSVILKQRKRLVHHQQQHARQFPLLGRCINREIDASNINYSNCAPSEEPVNSLSHELESGPVALIATVIRNADTFDYFVSLANQGNLSVRDLTETFRPAKLLPYMKSYPRSDIRLLILSYVA